MNVEELGLQLHEQGFVQSTAGSFIFCASSDVDVDVDVLSDSTVHISFQSCRLQWSLA